ncbi:hypothetical protein POSPLADRAFT_1131555, partial [Postia placenta MAD-698-R-SB12]
YSKSSRAVCHGPPPCKGSPVQLGVLRYGEVSFGQYGETVEWRHWGCVTPEILGRLASTKLERVPGFKDLRSDDQAKIRMAVGLRRIAPADIPETAKTHRPGSDIATSPPSTPGPSQKKRKAAAIMASNSSQPSSSRPGPSQPLRHVIRPEGYRRFEEEEDEVNEVEEIKDELYVVLKTSIVGIQYYKGLVGPGEEVRLVREPQNQHDRNAIQVMNIGGTQVGHLPRNVAGKLAPLMDQGLVTVEGVMHEGNQSCTHRALRSLKMYGASDKRALLEPRLMWATPGQRGFPPRNGVNTPVPGLPAPRPPPHVTPSRPPASQSYPLASKGYPSSQGSAYPSSSQRATGMTAAQQEAARKQQEAARKQQEALAKAAELRQVLNSLEKVDDEGRRSSLLDTLCVVEDVLGLPLHPSPPGIANGDLKVDLLKHQSQALQWCIQHEYPALPKKEEDKPVQFWQLRSAGGKTFYYNIATKTPQTQPPPLGRGALCADSMGLGKTLTMLALVIATKADIPTEFSKSTLIVAPLSILSNWEKQIQDHIQEGALTYCVYYGASRSMTPEELKNYDIVITTYQTVAGEHGDASVTKVIGEEPVKRKRKSANALFAVPWKRIILDEGHNIRNPRTKMAKAVCALNAQRRWILTGTPIINSPRDLGSILTFLQICRPLDDEDFYKRMVLRPLKDGDPAGAELFRGLMSHICIRRTKEMQDSEGNHLVPLPPVDTTLIPVTLTKEAREMYDAIEALSKQRLDNLIGQHGGLHSAAVHSNVLSMVTRLRQLALHPGLVPANYIQQLQAAEKEEDSLSPVQLTPENKIRLQSILAQAIEDNEECPICFGILNEPRITSCSHMFCLACISEVLSRDSKCPMDRRPLGMGDFVEPPPPTMFTQAPVRDDDEPEEENGLRSGSSAKIDQLVHLLKLTPDTEKSLVFSQFTSFLDKGTFLYGFSSLVLTNGHSIPYVRFDGKMSARRRQETIARFSVPLDESSPTVWFPQSQEPSSSGRSARRRARASNVRIFDGDAAAVDDDGDADFAPADDGEDSDFIDDEDADDAPRPKGKSKKAKAKAKGKGKRVRISTAPPSESNYLDGSAFGNEVNPKVMLISLKAGALGLNLTVANNVYLWWQEGIELQAIDRCNRIGQTKPVHVYQLIAEDTVESKVIDIQDKKKRLVEQAFSSIKNKETQRQKKEARLQGMRILS